jgi:hypothetical protein
MTSNGMELWVGAGHSSTMPTPSDATDASPTVKAVVFHSEWSDPIGGIAPPDLERHEAYVAYAKLLAAELRPHLLPFLAGVEARILVSPGIFSFDLPSARGAWIEIPELAECLRLLPWAEPNEIIH